MDNTIDIEPIVFIIRGFKVGKKIGDPFDYTLTLTKEGSIGFIHGLFGTINKDIYNLLHKEFLSLGITSVMYKRTTKGRNTWKEIHLKK